MTVTHLGNGVLRGVAADTKPTIYAVGSTFQETDTGNQFYWNGSTWTAMGGGGLSSPATISGVNFADVAITNTDSPYTMLATKTVVRADATSGNITINLPTAVGIAGRTYTIFRTDIASSTNIITVDANSTETIDSNLTYRIYSGEWLQIMSDGANWQVISRPTPHLDYYFIKGATRNFVAGSGRSSPYSGTQNSTTPPLTNTLFALPLIVGKTTKFDNIGFRITAYSSAGGVARAGIYRDNNNMYPGALIFDTGSIAIDAGAFMKNTTITSSLQVFQPGLYWLAYECGTQSANVRSFQVINMPLLGFDLDLGTVTNPYYGYSVAHTFGALPDPYTVGATALNANPTASNAIIAIALRAA